MSKNTMFAGTYACPDRQSGIYRFQQDPQSGELQPEGMIDESANPSFMAFSGELKYLFTVGELEDYAGELQGFVQSFAVTGKSFSLQRLSRQGSTGRLPCHICLSTDNSRLFTANYGDGSVAMFPVNSRGELAPPCCVVNHEGRGPHPERQEAPHPHSVTITPDGKFLIVADLGIDKLRVYAIGTTSLEPHSELSLQPGTGPRHVAFHPDNRHLFLTNELDSTMMSCRWNAKNGIIEEINTVAMLPDDFRSENTAADIHVSSDGLFVYGTNRGHDSIVTCAIDQKNFALRLLERTPCGGAHPRNFALAPDGRFIYIANMQTNNIACFRLSERGIPVATGKEVHISMPVCVIFA